MIADFFTSKHDVLYVIYIFFKYLFHLFFTVFSCFSLVFVIFVESAPRSNFIYIYCLYWKIYCKPTNFHVLLIFAIFAFVKNCKI